MAGLGPEDHAAIQARLAPLLDCLAALESVSRRLHPPDLSAVLKEIGAPDDALAKACADALPLAERLTPLAELLDGVSVGAVSVFSALRDAADNPTSMGQTASALRPVPRLLEAIYPLAGLLRPVHDYFLEPDLRGDDGGWRQFSEAAGDALTGAMAVEIDGVGPVALYVPEAATQAPRPLVVALHGGGGNGGAFLWSWVRAARSHGAIVAAPSAQGETWSITGEDVDAPRLTALVAAIGEQWSVDPARVLLTGMSDGGTYCYVAGLGGETPFTHLAPVAASFHPVLLAFAEPERIRGRPIRITHGALDWMFPVSVAEGAFDALLASGAAASFDPINDLSHRFPTEICAPLLDWMAETSSG